MSSTAWKGIDKDTSSTRIKYGPGAPMSEHAQKAVQFDDFTSIPVTAGDIPYGWSGYKGSDGAAAYPTVPGGQAAVGSAVLNGVARLVTGAGAGASLAANGSRLESGRAFRVSTGGLVMEARLKVPSTVTNLHLFVGLTGSVGSLVTPATLGASDALTAVATNAVGFLYDTAADTDNWWGIGINASSGSKANLGVAPSGSFFYILRIEVDTSGNTSYFIDGKKLGYLAAAIDPTVGQIAPAVVAFSRTNASKTVDVDYIHVEGDRI